MRILVLAALLLVGGTACSRKVEVTTAPSTASEVSLRVTNTATQAMSIYVTSGGSELFLRQVAANSTEVVAVPGVPSGSTVRLRATLADGSRSYTRDGVVLSGVFEWRVP
jgi:hypothetical protein